MRGAAVQTDPLGPSVRIELEPEFGGDHDLSTEGREGFANELFVCERAVNFGSVKECDSTLNSCPEKGDHFLLIRSRAIGKAHSHTTQPDCRDLQISFPKFAL